MTDEILTATPPPVDETSEATSEPTITETETPVAAEAPAKAEAPIEAEEPAESFGEMFAEFEKSHVRRAGDGSRQISGTVVSVDAESVYVDIGFKTEGVLLRSTFPNNAEDVKAGDGFKVSVKGRNEEGYYELSRVHVAQPKDWSALSAAFKDGATISGIVTAVVKGGLTVDVGVRAFMPSSRSGTRDAAELAKLVGQEIRVKITKLDVIEEDVVVDRRVIAEAEAKVTEQARFAEIQEGETVSGTVRSLASYGAFVDLGGIDGLLHISDMSWSRVAAAEDVVSVGQALTLKVLKVDAEGKRISLGLKQMEAEPWDAVAEKYKEGERVTGTVTRLMDFGAFVELEPGVEGLIHVSEMSWVKKVRKPSDLLKTGDSVDVLILKVDAAAKKMSLGLKQALGDPWADVPLRFPVGTEIEGPVTSMMKFGAFVELAEGVEGLVHVSEITADRRINHPEDELRKGHVVKAQVIGVDTDKRQIKLSMKQLIPTGLGEYLEEHKVGDLVSGRVVSVSGNSAVVELGEGIRATCVIAAKAAVAASGGGGALDLSSLTSMLNAKWKTGAGAAKAEPEALSVGQVRSFKLTAMDVEEKKIELELV